MDAALMPLIRRQSVRLQLHALAYNLGNFLRTLATPAPIKDWSLTSLKEKLIKIGANVVSHGRRGSEKPLRRHLAADRGTAASAAHVNSVRRSICHAFDQKPRETCALQVDKTAFSALGSTSARPDTLRKRVGRDPGLPETPTCRRLGLNRRPFGGCRPNSQSVRIERTLFVWKRPCLIPSPRYTMARTAIS
jgi:hypothetical protein